MKRRGPFGYPHGRAKAGGGLTIVDRPVVKVTPSEIRIKSASGATTASITRSSFARDQVAR